MFFIHHFDGRKGYGFISSDFKSALNHYYNTLFNCIDHKHETIVHDTIISKTYATTVELDTAGHKLIEEYGDNDCFSCIREIGEDESFRL